MVITARFASTCPTCNNPIAVGSQVNWERGSKATHRVCPPKVAAPAAAARPASRFLVASEVGAYVAGDGSVYHVKQTRAERGVAPRFYAERWVAIGGQRATESGTVQHGDWQYADANGNRYGTLLAGLIDAGKVHRMSADEVIDFATLTNRCVVHGGLLTDADSVDAGIGPVCAAKQGIDRKALAEAARRRRAASHGRDLATVSHTPSVPAPAPKTARETVADAGGRGDFEDRYAAIFGDMDPTVRRARPFTSARRSRPTVSRWSRPSDDDLGHAGGYGSDSDDYAF